MKPVRSSFSLSISHTRIQRGAQEWGWKKDKRNAKATQQKQIDVPRCRAHSATAQFLFCLSLRMMTWATQRDHCHRLFNVSMYKITSALQPKEEEMRIKDLVVHYFRMSVFSIKALQYRRERHYLYCRVRIHLRGRLIGRKNWKRPTNFYRTDVFGWTVYSQ